jgi:hypothetical protein
MGTEKQEKHTVNITFLFTSEGHEAIWEPWILFFWTSGFLTRPDTNSHRQGPTTGSNTTGRRNIRNTNWKGSSQSIPIPKRPKKKKKQNHQKTLRHHKKFQKSCRIQNQSTKISSFSIHHNEQIEKEYGKIIPFTIASNKIKLNIEC